MDKEIPLEEQEKILAIARKGNTSLLAIAYFRVALGLYYLDGVMTEEILDFKTIDRNINKFIYRSIGKGHSITSILQFMSGKKVVPVLESADFLKAFAEHFDRIPVHSIPFLLSVNLNVAKKISGIAPDGPVKDWIGWQ
jgi:hypothetical protein